MVRVAGGYAMVPHQCRDYRAWHQPADPRDVHALDVEHGWQSHRSAVAA
jgi:hypothetical protein